MIQWSYGSRQIGIPKLHPEFLPLDNGYGTKMACRGVHTWRKSDRRWKLRSVHRQFYLGWTALDRINDIMRERSTRRNRPL